MEPPLVVIGDHDKPRDPIPLYRQIADHFLIAVAVGHLRPEDPLPSTRRLASQFGVSPATAARALCELANDGVVKVRRGQVCLLSVRGEGPEGRKKSRETMATQLVQQALREAAEAGIEPQQFLSAFAMGVANARQRSPLRVLHERVS